MSWEHQFLSALKATAVPASLDPADFSPEYRALVPPALAARDARQLRELLRTGGDRFDLWEPRPDFGDGHYRLQVYGERERNLDELMPFLQNLGLRVIDQVPFRLDAAGRPLHIRSFAVRPAGDLDLLARRPVLVESLEALLRGWVENDELNGLIVGTGLSWREVDVFRAYRNYYFQLGSRFGRMRFHQALLDNPRVALLLFRYFEARFAPDGRWSDAARREEESLPPLRQELAVALDTVTDGNEDRILRDLFNLIDSTLRTDFYRDRPPAEHSIALKLASLGILNSPLPRPQFEIYVHARWMEGIHLRGAAVARGGLRWSDRPDDFRSEVLDLMQTQMIKNVLIVPLGAKGGFVVNDPAGPPAEREQQARRAYATLIRGLLNLTDNRTPNGFAPPPAVVAYDAPDPYLVVAADKGTAGLSDFANSIAAEYGFWLGDAFASGGSNGYHHKRLGITARGAWVAVRRHFREAGRDIDREAFTAVGVGSMDGDVFGNGMLLSRNIRLVGAFGSRHVFLDPNPDPEAAYRERERLFHLAGSSWDDYDRSLISAGGGVFRRDARDIVLAPEAQAALGVRRASVDGEGLIRLLLAAPVDLLWLGGIGTYVKSSGETHEDAADRANDPVRLDAGQIRAKVVGEGANLGFTQRARIEYALAGGRINTDAVDNSAGVDLSDHEVNLKILLAELERRGEVAHAEERNGLLAESSEDVVTAVLAHNDGQSLCLSLDLLRCGQDPEPFLEVADRLANSGLLDRGLEAFPGRKEVLAREPAALTRPELAVLMAYAKLALKRALLERPDFLDEPWTSDLLADYFPPRVRERFGAALRSHGLAREIIATQLSNRVIGQAGARFPALVEDWEPVALCRAVSAYFWFDRITGAGALRQKLKAAEAELPAERFHALFLQLEDLLGAGCRTALTGAPHHHPGSGADGMATHFSAYLEDLCGRQADRGQHALEAARQDLAVLNPTEAEVLLWAFRDRAGEFPALAALAERTGEALPVVAGFCDAIAECLGLRRMAARLAAVRPRDRWERRAVAALDKRLGSAPAALTFRLLSAGQRDPEALFETPAAAAALARLHRLERELTESAATALAPYATLAAAVEEVREAAEG